MAKRLIDADVLKKNFASIEDLRTLSTKTIGEVIKKTPTVKAIEIPESGIGDLSDGYHTFNELYHHRAVLFSVICNMMPDKAWKSKLHDTGDMYEGMFIVGIDTPQGQATYHYDINPYWDMFKVKELEKAPEWDGHTPAQAIERIGALGTDMAPVVNGEWQKIKNNLHGSAQTAVKSSARTRRGAQTSAPIAVQEWIGR